MSSHLLSRACAFFLPWNSGTHIMNYQGFKIEAFEAGRGLWHARIRRLDLMPVIIDDMLFSALEIGFAWPDPENAVTDAKIQIDQLNRRYADLGPSPPAERRAAA